jgi:hypothetical protein
LLVPFAADSVCPAQRHGVVGQFRCYAENKTMTIPVPHITFEKTWIDIWKDIDVTATFDVRVNQDFRLNEFVNIDKNIYIDADVNMDADIYGNFALLDVKVEEHDDHFNWQAGALTDDTSSVSQIVGQDTFIIPFHDPIDVPKFAVVAQADGHNTFTELTAVVEVFDTGGSFVNVVAQSITD